MNTLLFRKSEWIVLWNDRI